MGKALITRRGGSSDPISALLDGEKYGTSVARKGNYRQYGCAIVDRNSNENLGIMAFGNHHIVDDYTCIIAIDWASQTISVIKNTFLITPQVDYMITDHAIIRVWGMAFSDDEDKAGGVYFYPV